jgi:hypothetical protein
MLVFHSAVADRLLAGEIGFLPLECPDTAQLKQLSKKALAEVGNQRLRVLCRLIAGNYTG